MSIDHSALREDFPILNQNSPVYLDSAASMQMPRQVFQAMEEQQFRRHGNVHRGIHSFSRAATEALEVAREVLRSFLNARSAGEIIFTSGATQSLNMLAGCLRGELGAGDEILVSVMEHHSNFLPWQQLCLCAGASLRIAPIDENGDLDMEAFRGLLSPRTKLVSVTAVSNLLGTVNPVEDVIRIAHENGSLVSLDCAQSMRHGSIDVQALDCDFLSFSGHKMGGPTGTGVLYGKMELLERLPPAFFGGGMVEKVTAASASFAPPPLRFEAGTPNITGCVGLAAAAEYLEGLGPEEIAAYEAMLLQTAEKKLSALPDVEIIGHPKRRAGVLSFNIRGLHCFDVCSMLDRLGYALRSGHHCAQPLLEALGLDGTVRLSPAFYNSPEEISGLVRALERIIQVTEGARNGRHS